MAALGDSLTAAVNSCPAAGTTPCQENSWSTGTNPEVDSHAQRLQIPASAANNFSKAGDKAVDLGAQADKALASGVDYEYVTIFIGTNDTCTTRTEPTLFREQVRAAIAKLAAGLPRARVFVASIPDWLRVYELFQNDDAAFATWTAVNCRNFLTDDAAARAGSREHLMSLNRQLAQACARYSRCVFDRNAVFDWAIQPDYFANDYFHYSVQGQHALSAVTFDPAFRLVTRRTAAKLKVKRTSIRGGRLDAVLSITGRATGLLHITYLASGRQIGFDVALGPARSGEKRIRVRRRLSGAQRRVRTGIMTASYRGNAGVQPDRLRSRAANGISRLRLTDVSFRDLLRVAGTLDPDVSGVVRLRVSYSGADGKVAVWRRQQRIIRGRWAVAERLPEAVAVDPAAYLTAQYTGDAAARGGPYRGEQDGRGLFKLAGGG